MNTVIKRAIGVTGLGVVPGAFTAVFLGDPLVILGGVFLAWCLAAFVWLLAWTIDL